MVMIASDQPISNSRNTNGISSGPIRSRPKPYSRNASNAMTAVPAISLSSPNTMTPARYSPVASGEVNTFSRLRLQMSSMKAMVTVSCERYSTCHSSRPPSSAATTAGRRLACRNSER